MTSCPARRGGYGLEITRRGGSRLVGVDFSAVAIGQANRRARELGLADRAEFRVGELTATGLDTASVDAVLIVDSTQVADKSEWRAAEKTLWQEALTIDAGDDLAMRSMREEAQRVLASFDGMRRVLATATTP
ncbi:class I SAM-dependent methyltransferase [Amycolatopsis lurida]